MQAALLITLTAKIWDFFGAASSAHDAQLAQFEALLEEAREGDSGGFVELVVWWANAIPRLEAMPLLWANLIRVDALVTVIEGNFGVCLSPSLPPLVDPIGNFVLAVMDHICVERMHEGKKPLLKDQLDMLGSSGGCISSLKYLLLRNTSYATWFEFSAEFKDREISFKSVREWLEGKSMINPKVYGATPVSVWLAERAAKRAAELDDRLGVLSEIKKLKLQGECKSGTPQDEPPQDEVSMVARTVPPVVSPIVAPTTTRKRKTFKSKVHKTKGFHRILSAKQCRKCLGIHPKYMCPQF